MTASPTVLHVAPHPDDESIGAPGTLFSLRDAGWRVVNLAVSLGKMEQRERRQRELEEACRRADFELLILDPPANISRESTLADRDRLIERLSELFVQLMPSVVIGPSATDVHHGHEVTGSALIEAVHRQPRRIHIWQWGLWGDLADPNIFVPVSQQHLDLAKYSVAAHEGEVARNNYVDLIEARARVAAILGTERVFGWGRAGNPEDYAELLHETVWDGQSEHTPSEGRRLDPRRALGNSAQPRTYSGGDNPDG